MVELPVFAQLLIHLLDGIDQNTFLQVVYAELPVHLQRCPTQDKEVGGRVVNMRG